MRVSRKLDPTNGKLCAVPGCGTHLSEGNTSGLCRNHMHNREHCGCWRCVAKREDVPPSQRHPPMTKHLTPRQEADAAELRRELGWPDPVPPKDDSWKGEERLRGIKAPRGEGNGYNIKKAKWR